MTPAEQDFRWDGLAKPEMLSQVRFAIQGWGARAGLPADLMSSVTLAAYEAMANAAAHAYQDDQQAPLTVRVSRDAGTVTVVVADRGRWRFAASSGPGGRGLLLMEALAQELTVTRSEAGTTVEMRWSMPADRAELAAVEVTEGAERSTDEDRLREVAAINDTALARLDTDALAQEMLARVRELLGVDTATVLQYDPAAEDLIATASSGIEQEVRQGVRIPFGLGFAGTVAAKQKPMVIERVDETTVLNPLLWEAGLRTLLGVPMLIGGRLTGVLHVGSRVRRSFTERDISLLQMAADRLALAIEAHVSRAERAAASALQRSLLPSRLPSGPGFDFAARYVPSATLDVGGDWYDVFSLPEDRVGIVIGDVSGHGLAAAVVMGRLRSALRAYALDNDSPAVVLDKLDRKANHFEAGTMATVAYGVIDIAEHRLRLSLAGHLPPVIAVPGEPSEFVDALPDPPIGFALSTRPRRCQVVDLPPGALACFYTDGLIERRDQPIDDGLATLRRIMVASSAEATCATLMSRFIGNQSLGDDVAVLVVHRTGS
jgi:anti-sigma regulatory factor (Ser/Thr protein kinase)/putative methionine-R-sulfoxide reductase with GAF domain